MGLREGHGVEKGRAGQEEQGNEVEEVSEIGSPGLRLEPPPALGSLSPVGGTEVRIHQLRIDPVASHCLLLVWLRGSDGEAAVLPGMVMVGGSGCPAFVASTRPTGAIGGGRPSWHR